MVIDRLLIDFCFLCSHRWAKQACFFFLGLRFALDPASVPPSLRLSHSSLTITYRGERPSSPPPRDRGGGAASPDLGFTLPEACADVIIGRGQYYWEVEVCNSSVYRLGKNPPRFARLGPVPALSLFAETLIISQHGSACFRRQLRVNMHAHVIVCKGHQTAADEETSNRQTVRRTTCFKIR